MYFYFILCACVFMNAHVCAYPCGGQKGASDLLELELGLPAA